MSDRGEYRSIRTVLIDGPDFQRLTPAARLTFLCVKLSSAGVRVSAKVFGSPGEYDVELCSVLVFFFWPVTVPFFLGVFGGNKAGELIASRLEARRVARDLAERELAAIDRDVLGISR